MKNSIKILSLLSLACIILFSACQKENPKAEDKTNPGFESPWTETSSALGLYLQSDKQEPEKGILLGSKEILVKTFDSEEPVVMEVKRSSKNNNIYQGIPVSDVGPVGPVDPTAGCWKEFQAIYDSHIDEWQAWANKHCMPFMTCITIEKCGLSVLISVPPKTIKCIEVFQSIIELYSINPFPFGPDQYESKEVYEFIQRN